MMLVNLYLSLVSVDSQAARLEASFASLALFQRLACESESVAVVISVYEVLP